MFDLSLSQKMRYNEENPFCESPHLDIKYLAHTNWEEHCVECSPPYCYNNCENYIKRADKRCVRMLYGIQKIDAIDGPLGYGIKCTFRKWAKLETIFTGVPITIEEEKEIASKYERWGKIAVNLSNATTTFACRFGPYSIFDGIRRRVFLNNISKIEQDFDYLFINCFLKDKKSVPLLVQIDNDCEIFYTKIHNLAEKENIIKIPVKSFLKPGVRVFVTPLEESDTTIYFRWLDFIKENNPQIDVEQPAQKVKVVAWDLDNTLWKGTLVNDPNVCLNETALSIIKELDRRGILNTICSKNDQDQAMAKLKEFGIDDYFLYPAINWGQKSENLKAIAQQLNVGINSFVFIDDNIREREEVSQALPMVRIFSDTDIPSLLDNDEFEVPVTETSKKRRQLYIEDSKRNSLKANYSENYDDFLRSLEMVLTVERINETNKKRCYELLSRSNQLNLSTNRYTEEGFESLISNPEYLCFAFRVSDKFGDYGIVSFLSIHLKGNSSQIKDLVISCRIAKKKVENAIIRSLKEILILKGVESIGANLVITKKNGPLVNVFMELPFTIKEKDEKHVLYILENISDIPEDNIIEIR